MRVASSILRAAGYRVEETVCPNEAARKVTGGLAPDLLLTGFIFKETNGIALAEQIRVRAPGLPVLIVTTGALPVPAASADCEFHVLAKPFSAASLRRAVASLLPVAAPSMQRV